METMRVLFVDDLPDLLKSYSDNLRSGLRKREIDATVDKCLTIEEGLSALAENSYDVVITDLLFPAPGVPEERRELHTPRGLEIIEEARRNSNHPVVVGLSDGNIKQYPKLEKDALLAGATIFQYRPNIYGSKAYGWKGFVDEILAALRARAAEGQVTSDGVFISQRAPHVLVFVALETELTVLQRRWSLSNVEGQRRWVGQCTARNIPVHVVPAYGPGRVRAAITVLNYLRGEEGTQVRAVVSMGICGGFTESEARPGDVFVPSRVDDLGTRKLKGTRTEFRPEPYPVSKEMAEFLHSGSFERAKWMSDIVSLPDYPDGQRATLHLDTQMVCSDEVVASDTWRKKMLGASPKALGVDMESGGVAAAAQSLSLPYFVIRGVSDNADPLKTDDRWRRLGMEAAAITLEHFLGGSSYPQQQGLCG